MPSRGMGYNRQPADGIRKGTKHRPQYTGKETAPIREEFERVLGSKELALNCMDALIRVLSQNEWYIAHRGGRTPVTEER